MTKDQIRPNGVRSQAMGLAIALVITLTATARAATITVDSLADTGAPGICTLRDAITAANMATATNGCAAGTGSNTIRFSVTGTISLASTLPEVSDTLLTIRGPALPRITINGGGKVQIIVVASGATLQLNNVVIADGFTQTEGGGIENDGTLTVTNSTFSGNKAICGVGCGFGGGIANLSGTLTLIDSTFSQNSTNGGGGGIGNIGTLTIINSSFSANEVNVGIFGNGGGIDNVEGTATITDSTFTRNSAVGGEGGTGGGVVNGGTMTITNSTFSSNGSTFGGGVENNGLLTISNSTFYRNSANGDGGGIGNGGNLAVSNSTFSGNSSVLGIGNISAGSAATRTAIKSTILAAGGSGSNCGGIITDAGYNISDDSTCNFSATGSRNSTDPMLDPAGLSNNGGPTRTIALLDGSPAIDAIPLAHCTDQASPPKPIITDQRLFPRPDAAEASCDIGAYEVQDAAFIPFSGFRGGLRIDPDVGVFRLSGEFNLGPGGSIDPTMQPVAFSVGSYTIRLPIGSFVKYSTGYVYQKRISNVFLCIYIKFTSTPGSYVLLANRYGGNLKGNTSPVPVTLTIGDNSGSVLMKAKFD